jgi:hypothetical protein
MAEAPDPLPPCYTLYDVLIHTGKGGGGVAEPVRMVEGR